MNGMNNFGIKMNLIVEFYQRNERYKQIRQENEYSKGVKFRQ